jgi:hypothetical protein
VELERAGLPQSQPSLAAHPDFPDQAQQSVGRHRHAQGALQGLVECQRQSPGKLQPNQEQLIKSIFIKYGKDVSKPIGELLNDFFCTEDNWAISAAIDMTRYINYLLPKINAKIVELEMQL